MKKPITKADALAAIRVLKSEFVCCAARDYETGCISCEARRIASTLADMVREGTYA